MKMVGRAALLLCFLTLSGLLYADTTVGTSNTGNCVPFMCNNSGTSNGESIDYQQVFAPSAFSGATTINSITWYFASQYGGNGTVLGGTYDVYLGYSNNPVNGLDKTLANNINATDWALVGAYTVTAFSDKPSFTEQLSTPFTYNPTADPLLLQVVVTNQDNVSNGQGNGYNQADYSGLVTSRAYCIKGGCGADAWGLVTTFGTATPEPATLLLLGSGLLGLAGLRRKLIG